MKKIKGKMMKKLVLIIALCTAAAVVYVGYGRPSFGQDKKAQPFHAKFWNWLQQADYQNWAPAPGQSGHFYKGKPPHGAFLKVYMNRTVFGNLEDPPHGSIIIKENYSKEKKLMAVTVMYRIKGYDKENHDWFWAKYKNDGTPFEMKNMPLAGKVKGCINCHGSAGGKDFVFLNDSE